MLIGGEKCPPPRECADARCGVLDHPDDMFARSTLLLLVLIAGELEQHLHGFRVKGILELELVRDMDCHEGCRLIVLGEDAATIDRKEDKAVDSAGKGIAEESKGVDSDGGRFDIPAFASRLHTGQNVLHDVSHRSTQAAWNSVR